MGNSSGNQLLCDDFIKGVEITEYHMVSRAAVDVVGSQLPLIYEVQYQTREYKLKKANRTDDDIGEYQVRIMDSWQPR